MQLLAPLRYQRTIRRVMRGDVSCLAQQITKRLGNAEFVELATALAESPVATPIALIVVLPCPTATGDA